MANTCTLCGSVVDDAKERRRIYAKSSSEVKGAILGLLSSCIGVNENEITRGFVCKVSCFPKLHAYFKLQNRYKKLKGVLLAQLSTTLGCSVSIYLSQRKIPFHACNLMNTHPFVRHYKFIYCLPFVLYTDFQIAGVSSTSVSNKGWMITIYSCMWCS